ncbi:hypothetical protein [Methylobacterium soli]|uniref:hypothetical protein n=1 Tax=Methylobacterium soli TaxID=553447 RepID=UPI00178320F8|nr:hypothetical protein [Methylobacterium soli]GJE45696.1 hypothetical protein AEGHOMDF_4896 [Methylobacterium soli]
MQHSADDPGGTRVMVDVGYERTSPEDLLFKRLVGWQQYQSLEQAGKAGELYPKRAELVGSSRPGLPLGAGTGAAEGIGPELGRIVQDERGNRASIFDVMGIPDRGGKLTFRDRHSR